MAAIPKDEEKKKRANFGDAAAAALDRSVNQIDTGPMVGKPGDFPVNPDGSPMTKPAAGFQPGAAPAQQQSRAFPGVTATVGGMVNDVRSAVRAGNYGAAAGEVFRGTSALPIAVADDVVMNPARKIGGFISNNLTKPAIEVGKDFGRAALGMQPGSAAQQGQKPTLAGDATMPGNDPARFMAQPIGQTVSAPDGTPKAPEQEPAQQQQAPATGAVIDPPKPAAGFVPADIRYSGNDWQMRNNLRNAEVSASSITEKNNPNSPAMLKYKAMLDADEDLLKGKNPAIESRNRDAAFMDRTQAAEGSANYRASIANNIAQQRVDNEGVKLGFEANAAKQVQALQKQIVEDDGKDPKRTAALQEKMQALTGKYQRQEPQARMTVVNRPDTMAADGVTKLGGGQSVIVQNPDGSFREAAIGGGQQQPGPLVVSSPEQLAKLPKGAVYTGPDGKQYRKD